MRSAKVKDIWKKINSKHYTNFISSVSFVECNGFSGDVTIQPGITAICGLNGVGKSSIISSIAKLLGISDDSKIRKSKFLGEINVQLIINDSCFHISENSTALNNGLDIEFVRYIDSDLAIECIKYWDQENIEELIASEEEYPFTKEQVEAINQIIGKNYCECIAYEIEEAGQNFTPVYFNVKTDSAEYGSQDMGIGEHFLLYLYYSLNQISDNSILLIEEPESYISIHSQKQLLNYIAKTILEKNLSVILTTHSPFILSHIPPANIRMVTNMYGKMQIQTPDKPEIVKKLLGVGSNEMNSKNATKTATLFVEDYAARLFLASLLKKTSPALFDLVDIVSLNGESNITKILQFDIGKYMSHRIVGIYDGDMLPKESDYKINQIAKLPYCYLPIKKCVEIDMQEFVNIEKSSIQFQKELGVDAADFNAIIESLKCEDHHDWFIEFSRRIGKSEEAVIEVFFNVWSKHNKKSVEKFINDLQKKITKEEFAQTIS